LLDFREAGIRRVHKRRYLIRATVNPGTIRPGRGSERIDIQLVA
jgi:hypothetical protein